MVNSIKLELINQYLIKSEVNLNRTNDFFRKMAETIISSPMGWEEYSKSNSRLEQNEVLENLKKIEILEIKDDKLIINSKILSCDRLISAFAIAVFDTMAMQHLENSRDSEALKLFSEGMAFQSHFEEAEKIVQGIGNQSVQQAARKTIGEHKEAHEKRKLLFLPEREVLAQIEPPPHITYAIVGQYNEAFSSVAEHVTFEVPSPPNDNSSIQAMFVKQYMDTAVLVYKHHVKFCEVR